jgi:DNA polymerase I-like protein with 3'-5' exonuclease and polymerase domains
VAAWQPLQASADTLFGVEHLSLFDKCSCIVFDTETTGLQPVKGGLRLVQVAAEGKPVVVVDVWKLDIQGKQILKDFFERTVRIWFAHNATFDVGWLQAQGIYPAGRVFCTMLATKLVDNGTPNLKVGLASAVNRYMQIELSKEQQVSDWSASELSKEQLVYAANDVRYLVILTQYLNHFIHKKELGLAWILEAEAIPAIAQMWRTGIPFDRGELEQLQEFYVEEIDRLGCEFLVDLDAAMPDEHKLPRDDDGSFNLRTKTTGSLRLGTKKLAGFNLNSSKQLIEKLTVLLGKPPLDKDNKPSASRSALRSYEADHRVIHLYLAWKRAEKRRQMVVSLMEHQDPDGYIRASYLQLGADTGRMSCRNPNLQQVPRDSGFRKAARAKDGYVFVVADFGQMELRLAAAVSKDPIMIDAFQRDIDLHTLTAEAIYPEPTDDEAELKARRQVAKSANFGLLYGSGAAGLREYAGAMGITMTLEDAQVIREKFHQQYEGIDRWQKEQQAASQKPCRDRLGMVRIPRTGMIRYLPGDMNRLTTRCNTPIQGAGAAILKKALGDLWLDLRQVDEDEARLSAVVHDEVLLLVKEGFEDKWKGILSKRMVDAEALWLEEIPAVADAAYGKTWYEAK